MFATKSDEYIIENPSDGRRKQVNLTEVGFEYITEIEGVKSSGSASK